MTTNDLIPLRALLIEDSEDDALLVQRTLTRGGFELVSARVETALAMVTALAQGEWDVILADYHMPGFGAPQALALLQANGRDIPFIVVSGKVGEEAAVEMMRSGAADYVMKGRLTRLAPAVRRELGEAVVRRERRQAEAALRASEERLRLALEGGQLGIWDFDLLTERFLAITALCKVNFGLSPEAPPNWEDSLASLYGDDQGRARSALQQTLSFGHGYAMDYRIIGGDGQLHWVSALGSVIRDDAGQPVRFIGTTQDITERKRVEEALRVSTEKLQALSHRLVAVQEAERREIARELHDQIGQLLTGLSLTLETGKRLTGEALRQNLTQAKELTGDVISRVRQLSLELRPTMLDDLGLLPALLWHVQRFTAQSGIRIAFSHEGLNRRFSAKIETAAYRIIQETLTNVARHAGVGEAAVRVWTEHDRLHVRVEDTGSGFDTEQALASYASSGLLGMKERASLLGGRFAVDSAVGAGTHVLVELPITDPSTLEGESP
jgi:two-component system sensor histidine kinase UhpB